jgi:hypothetical protein
LPYWKLIIADSLQINFWANFSRKKKGIDLIFQGSNPKDARFRNQIHTKLFFSFPDKIWTKFLMNHLDLVPLSRIWATMINCLSLVALEQV